MVGCFFSEPTSFGADAHLAAKISAWRPSSDGESFIAISMEVEVPRPNNTGISYYTCALPRGQLKRMKTLKSFLLDNQLCLALEIPQSFFEIQVHTHPVQQCHTSDDTVWHLRGQFALANEWFS